MPVEEKHTNETSLPEAILIWLVEDDELYRSTIQAHLNKAPRFNCPNAFSSCEETLAALVNEVQPDVILLDLGFPEGKMDGIVGIPKIKQASPSTQIIILTVWDDDDRVFDALRMGASGYLLKNSPKDKLFDSINEVLLGGAPMNAQIARKVLTMFNRLAPQKTDYGLTDRETGILRLMVEGLTKKEIADKLYLSFHTVNTHIKSIYTKMHVNNIGSAVRKAVSERLV